MKSSYVTVNVIQDLSLLYKISLCQASGFVLTYIVSENKIRYLVRMEKIEWEMSTATINLAVLDLQYELEEFYQSVKGAISTYHRKIEEEFNRLHKRLQVSSIFTICVSDTPISITLISLVSFIKYQIYSSHAKFLMKN